MIKIFDWDELTETNMLLVCNDCKECFVNDTITQFILNYKMFYIALVQSDIFKVDP